jgi:hypothetical protein
MFTVEERAQVQAWLVARARSDPRVTGGALIGSLAAAGADRWSDVDLTFGVAAGVRPGALLDDWTAAVRQEWGLVHYWDLPFRTSLYRVFLLPSGLEADVSATPAPEFGARGSRFRLLFGATQAGEPTPPPDAQDLIGRGWHHVLHAHAALERGQPWRAEHWISGVRNQTLALACVRRGVEAREGRGIDQLPAADTDPLREALVRSLEATELWRALGVATAGLLQEVERWDAELSARLGPILREFSAR